MIIFSKFYLGNYDGFSITVDGVALKLVKSVYFLDLNLDIILDRHTHTRYVINKLSNEIYMFNSTKHLLHVQHLTMLYCILLDPYLIYGIILWGSGWSSLLNPISIKQIKAIQFIDKAKYSTFWRTYTTLKWEIVINNFTYLWCRSSHKINL